MPDPEAVLNKIEYNLPEEKIALFPARPSDSSSLMVVHLENFKVEHRVFNEITDYFVPGDVLAVNNSRVIPGRLKGRRITGGRVEFLLLEKKAGKENLWRALGRPASRLKEGEEISVKSPKNEECFVKIRKKKRKGGFLLETPGDILKYGRVPLPPYIASKRANVDSDKREYQSNFSEVAGSAAASTSTLHFTPGLIEEIKKKGAGFAPVTLHIGPGTFRPQSRPGAEKFSIQKESVEKLKKARRVCACGTTVMRTLETVFKEKGGFEELSGKTDLYITPGFDFKSSEMFLTNFHLPGTSLLEMVAAYIEKDYPGEGSERLLHLYSEAIEKDYRFLSYGDAMLLIS